MKLKCGTSKQSVVKSYLAWKLATLEMAILFMDLVSDDILQMALGTDLLKKFGGSLGEK